MQKGLVILVCLIVLLAGCAQQSAPGGAPPSKIGESGQPPTAPQPGTPSQPLATRSNDINTCLGNCNTLTDESLQNTCKAGCYLGAATEDGDVAKCDSLLTIKEGAGLYDTCISNVATKLNDPSLCSRITGTFHDICLSSIADAKADATVCEGIGDATSRDGCISTVAAKKKDPSLCGKVTQDFMKQSCIEGTQ